MQHCENRQRHTRVSCVNILNRLDLMGHDQELGLLFSILRNPLLDVLSTVLQNISEFPVAFVVALEY